MGEAGSEAIMPLNVGRTEGRLGVEASGNGSTNVVVNVSVDASGTDVQGDEDNARQMGSLIAAAVQGEILKQQRPGGILSNTR